MESSIHLQSLAALSMPDTKRIPAAEPLGIELSELKWAGQTDSQLSEEMIEEKKKARLFRDLEKIEKEGEFVQLPWQLYILLSISML